MAEAHRRQRVNGRAARALGAVLVSVLASCAPRVAELPLESPLAAARGSEPGATRVRTAFQGGFDASAEEQIRFVAERHELWVLSGGPAKLAKLRAANPSALALRYAKIGGLHGPVTRPPAGDPDWAEVERGDLIARDPSGRAVRNTENGWYYVDILEPGHRARWSELLIARLAVDLEGYDGVMLDNAGVVHASLMSARPAEYDDARYFEAVHDLLRRVRAALPGKTIVFNSYGGFAPPELRGPTLLDVADGIYFEGFSSKVNGAAFGRARLTQQIGDFAAAAAADKITVALDYVPATDLDGRLRSLAAFLLGAGERSYHFVTDPRLGTAVQEYPEDTLDLGTPLGMLRARADGLVSRRYERGLVLLNADEAPVVFDVPGTRPVETLRLAGGGAFPSAGSLEWVPAPHRLTLAPQSAAIIR